MNKSEPKTTAKDWAQIVFAVLCIVFIVWSLAAETVYQFRHPEKTDTQRFLEYFDAMRFK